MDTPPDIRTRFAQLFGPGAPEPPLGHAALLIAAENTPSLDIDRYLDLLAGFATELEQRIGSELDPYLLIGIINRYLFDELKFRGDRDHYYNPANSLLDQVIDRRLGIPVTLGLIYLEIVGRLGLPIYGTRVPGHFLVAYPADDELLLIDTFNRGDVILPHQLPAFLKRYYGDQVRYRAEFLQPLTNRAILGRLLRNLKMVYIGRADLQRAVSVSDRLVLLDPAAAREYRDRGVLNYHLSQFSCAVPDFERYLRLNPTAPDAGKVRSMVVESRKRLGRDG